MSKTPPRNLMDAIFEEMNRVRKLIKEYEQLPNGVGAIGAQLLQNNINQAERAIRSGDVLDMLREYEALKQCE